MMRSLYAGISGLSNHQTKMDVIGNNIANVNTAGFKSSRVTFVDMLSQTMRSASGPEGGRGGTNPYQIGLGMNIGSIDVMHTPGAPMSTGKPMDMSIEGSGFFIVGEGDDEYFTRAGNFDFDINNTLVNPNGLKVKGWVLGTTETKLDTGREPVAIDLSAWANNAVAAGTTKLEIAKNLDSRMAVQPMLTFSPSMGQANLVNATPQTPYVVELGHSVFDKTITLTDGTIDLVLVHNAHTYDPAVDDYRFDRTTGIIEFFGDADGDGTSDLDVFPAGATVVVKDYDSVAAASYSIPSTVYDQNGIAHDIIIQMRKTANSPEYLWEANIFIKGDDPATGIVGYEEVNTTPHEIKFDSEGRITEGNLLNADRTFSGERNVNFTINFSALTQLGQETTAIAVYQDGYEPGSLQNITVDQTGSLIGNFSNGKNIVLGQVALATFSNPAGLTKEGNTLFRDSRNSGVPLIAPPGVSGSGIIKPETLEMSNVDLSKEFVDMITTQRGFQASSRIITTSDEMLQELVNLKR